MRTTFRAGAESRNLARQGTAKGHRPQPGNERFMEKVLRR